jgi:hypothetical protein
VKIALVFFDGNVTRQEKNGGDGIQRGIKTRQVLNCHGKPGRPSVF